MNSWVYAQSLPSTGAFGKSMSNTFVLRFFGEACGSFADPVLLRLRSPPPPSSAVAYKNNKLFTTKLSFCYAPPLWRFSQFFQIRILKNCHKWCKRLRFSFAVTLLLWSPYVIGQTIIFLPCDFYLLSSSSFFSSPNLGGRRLDVYHTSTHGVALVRI